MIFSHWGGKVSVRTQRHRIDATGKLFDIEADPAQDRDITAQQPEIATRLAQAAEAWKKELLPGLRNDKRPFPVGYPEFPLTQLPARDGVPHGNVRRSAPAPNCSFFTNWTGIEDRITWDIEVATKGRYEATVYYACPQKDIGSTVELSFNGKAVQATVSEPNDPPLIGAENDRVPRRGESYVKDFKPLRIGSLDLRAARGELSLRALQIPGQQVMEVRGLVLNLVQPE
jgi:hypothetical protein